MWARPIPLYIVDIVSTCVGPFVCLFVEKLTPMGSDLIHMVKRPIHTLWWRPFRKAAEKYQLVVVRNSQIPSGGI